MPMITLNGTTLNLAFNPLTVPQLRSLSDWSPGDTFVDSASWNAPLDPVDGLGSLFNNQYGFMFMANPMMGRDVIPVGRALGIRLQSRSSSLLESWNYVNSQNRFDEVFGGIGDQVLWSGSMWHNYFTVPTSAAPGTYTASFEVFVANTTFTVGTGFADYSPAARAALADPAYSVVTFHYTWDVVPEPSVSLLAALGFLAACVRRAHREP